MPTKSTQPDEEVRELMRSHNSDEDVAFRLGSGSSTAEIAEDML